MKKNTLFVLMLLAALMLLLTGCKKPNLGVVSNGDNTMTITAVNAKKDFFGGTAGVTLEEGQKIVIDSSLNAKGEILLRFSLSDLSDPNLSISELTAAGSSENAAYEVTVKGPGVTEVEAAPGSYALFAEVKSTASGTIDIRVK